MINWFYIGGSYTSKVNLAKLISDNLSDKLNLYFEPNSINYLFNKNTNLLNNDNHDFIGFSIENFTLDLDTYVPQFQELFEKSSKGIFLLRDCRDVVSSIILWPTWSKSIIEQTANSNTGFATKYSTELSLCRQDTENNTDLIRKQNIYYCSLMWKAKTDYYFYYKTQNKDVIGINYNSMFRDPQTQGKRLTDFLGIDYNSNLENIGNTDSLLSLIDNYKNTLSETDLTNISTIIGDLNDQIIITS